MRIDPELGQQLRDHWADDEVWAVLSDQLQGEPLGDLIAFELALASAPPQGKEDLVQLRGALRAELHRLPDRFRDWESRGLSVKWTRGFLERVSVRARTAKRDLSALDVTQRLRDLLTDSVSRFVRDLSLDLKMDEDDVDACIEAVVAAAPPLVRLELRLASRSPSSVACDLEPLWRAIGRLGTLILRAERQRLRFGEIAAPALGAAEIRGPLEGNLEALRAARWPGLQRLHLEPTDRVASEDMVPILDAEEPASLRDLGLHFEQASPAAGDALCRLLPETKVLRRLQELDLSRSGVTDRGAAAILERSQAFAHLGRLDLSRNRLTDAWMRGEGTGLRTLCRHVVLHDQIRNLSDPGA